jgi:hypothetical protein
MPNGKPFQQLLGVFGVLQIGLVALASTGSLGPCLNDSGARFLMGALGAAVCALCIVVLSAVCLAKGARRIGALGLLSQVLLIAVPLAIKGG